MTLITANIQESSPSGFGLLLPNQEPGINTTLRYVPDAQGPKVALVGGEAVITEPSSLVTGVTCKLLIGGVDWTETLLTLDAAIATNKQMECRLALTRTDSLSAVNIRPGQQVTVEHYYGAELINVIKGYVSAPPSRTGDKYTVEVRSTFKQDANKNYCGPVPTTAGQLARIYCEANGLTASALPEGHALAEQVDNFIGEPLEILADAYAPSGYTVHEDFQGRIQVSATLNSTVELARKDYIDISYGTSSEQLDTTVFVENAYARYDGFDESTKEYTLYSDNYNEDNTYPFFSGGWTRTDVTEKWVGATLINKTEKVFGYITASDVFASDVKFLECSLTSPVPTTFGLIYTRELKFYTVQLASGYSAIYAEELNANGKYAQSGLEDRGQGLENKWFLREGQIERQLKKYVLEQQTNSDLCARDQTWLIVDAYTQKEGFLNGGQYSVLNTERNWYSAQEFENDSYREPKMWTKYVVKGRYDQPTGQWVETPLITGPGAVPPEAQFIQPQTTQIVVKGYAEILE